MLSDELPKQIELLVDNLRKQNSANFSLTDVASVTEVLIGTMQAYFKSVDTSIYRECRSLSDYISNAREEIAALQPGDEGNSRIPRAGMELDAIVQQTEEATNTIMECAEEMMALDPDDHEAYQAAVQDNVMKIFEACSFQDITGQRISKVVETLSHIEQRVLGLRSLLGITDEDIERAHSQNDEVDEDKALLSGPALEGEGIDQSAVDDLIGTGADKGGGDKSKEDKAAAPAPEPPKAEKPAPKPAAKPAEKPKPQAAEPAKPEPPKKVSPKQLDSMFKEDFDPTATGSGKDSGDEGDSAATQSDQSAPADADKADKADKDTTQKDEAKKDESKKAAPKGGGKDDDGDLPAGEDISQDDIDALFG
ncbi:protein phosphatase CheZ [Yunchengibacter salinarum]|uniref:protein phosphatase CheZ n=1 Tax=Yunchengibacter salinarum TaxID=3133399 RepID=UPI0035B69F23